MSGDANEPDDRPSGAPFGMSDEQLVRFSWILAAIFFAIAIVSFIGEVLGWWNDLGELGMTVGTLAGLGISLGAAYYNAGKTQVAGVHETVEDNNGLLEDNNELLEDNNELLGENNEIVAESSAKLDQLDQLDQLEKLGKLEKLQTLDHQVELLQSIRDRL